MIMWLVASVFLIVVLGCAVFVLRLAWQGHRADDAEREEDVLDRQLESWRDRWNEEAVVPRVTWKPRDRKLI